MRTISADNEAILQAGARAVAVRLQVKDAGGTFRDLTTYPGVDLVRSLSWGEDLDSDGVTWSATLAREQRSISIAPMMEASPLNRGFNPAAAYAPLLQVGRQMKVEYSMQAYGDPRARSWTIAFEGYVDKVNSAEGDAVKLGGRGLEAAIINAFVKRERVYAFCQGTYATKGAFIWPDPNIGATYTTFAVGDLVIPTNTKTNGHFYRATSITTGITAATEPTWPTGGGSTVVDGGVTWTESGATSIVTGTAVETVMQQILNDNMTSPPTLDCPVSPSWLVKNFLVGRQNPFAELKVLADQVAWILRYVVDAGVSKLRLYDPARSNTTAARTFSPAQYGDPTKLEVDWSKIRNCGRCVYSDSQDLDASGQPKRKAVEVTDAASITKYTELFCETGEASTSNIDTAAEATSLITRVISDCAEPSADLSIPLRLLFPFAELSDLYAFSADGVRFSSEQKLALVSVQHEYSSTSIASSTVSVRGKPASNSASGWFARMIDADNAEQHLLTAVQTFAPIALSADTNPVGGTRLTFDWQGAKDAKDVKFEVHVAPAGFALSSTTVAQVSSSRSVDLGNLDPEITYEALVVATILNASKPVRGQPSERITFTPGRAKATHLNPNVEWRRLPLNGGFETQFAAASPPDFWFVGSGFAGTAGAWNETVFLISDGSGLQGNNYISLASTLLKAANLFSAEFSVNELLTGYLSSFRKAVSGGAALAYVGISFYDYLHAFISSAEESFALNTSTGSWVEQVSAAVTPPAGARFARVYVRKAAGAGEVVHFDSVGWEVLGGAAGGTRFATLSLTQPDFPYTPKPTLTVPTGATVRGIKLVKTVRTNGDTLNEAIDVSQWSQSGTTITFDYISGLTVGLPYVLTLELSYA